MVAKFPIKSSLSSVLLNHLSLPLFYALDSTPQVLFIPNDLCNHIGSKIFHKQYTIIV